MVATVRKALGRETTNSAQLTVGDLLSERRRQGAVPSRPRIARIDFWESGTDLKHWNDIYDSNSGSSARGARWIGFRQMSAYEASFVGIGAATRATRPCQEFLL